MIKILSVRHQITLCFLLFICSCSGHETQLTLVCSGVQTIDSRDKISNYQYPTERRGLTKTYKFQLLQKNVEKDHSSETKLTWVLNTDAQPEIFEENRKIVLELPPVTVELFKFVFVRKDDISVKSTYSRIENVTRQDYSSYSLNIDRVSGRVGEQFISSSKRFSSSEIFEGSCIRSEQNKI
jgi:hypothetical protein